MMILSKNGIIQYKTASGYTLREVLWAGGALKFQTCEDTQRTPEEFATEIAGLNEQSTRLSVAIMERLK